MARLLSPPLHATLIPMFWANAWSQHAKGNRFNEVVEQGLRDQFEQRYFVLVNSSARNRSRFRPFFVIKQDPDRWAAEDHAKHGDPTSPAVALSVFHADANGRKSG